MDLWESRDYAMVTLEDISLCSLILSIKRYVIPINQQDFDLLSSLRVTQRGGEKKEIRGSTELQNMWHIMQSCDMFSGGETVSFDYYIGYKYKATFN